MLCFGGESSFLFDVVLQGNDDVVQRMHFPLLLNSYDFTE